VHPRPRRLAAALCAALLLPALAACGDASSGTDEPETQSEASSTTAKTGELSEVSFRGDVGKSLKATWSSEVDLPESTTVTTLVEGDGDPVADGDTVSTYLYVGNGSAQKDLYSDYDNGAPEAIPNTDQAGEVFRALFSGATYGSRVAAVTTATALFGENVEGNQLGIGADDTVVLVADLMEKQQESPTPTDDAAHDASPDTQPSVVEKDGAPTGLDFSGIDEPALDTPVQRVVLEQGTGDVVKASDTVKINYLGATYDAKQPFDESFSKEPLTSALSDLIPGWTIALTGVKVGSRVLIQIPPAYGYGAQGSGAIPANATLWFVIDVLAVQ
jgi:peptidylprolyl isomerase